MNSSPRRFFIAGLLIVLFVALIVWLRYAHHVKPESIEINVVNNPIYTNPTLGYSLYYPKGITIAQTNSTDCSQTTAEKDCSITFSRGARIVASLVATAKTKNETKKIEDFAKTSITPLDKVTITNPTSFVYPGAAGTKELVTITDSTYQGMVYFTEDANNFYTFYTYESSEQSDVISMLSQFHGKETK